jgi:hypothetical protein
MNCFSPSMSAADDAAIGSSSTLVRTLQQTTNGRVDPRAEIHASTVQVAGVAGLIDWRG